jgi:hypothetical protein
MADGPLWHPGTPVLDYQGAPDDGRTWVMREKVLEDRVRELEFERDFLRTMLDRALASNRDTKEDS